MIVCADKSTVKTMLVKLCYVICIGNVLGHIPVPQPTFKSNPVSIKAYENDTIHLPCDIDNLGDNVVRWWKGGTLVSDSSDPGLIIPDKVKIWDNFTLEIEELSRDDTGRYLCQVVRQDPWNPLEQIHVLEVWYPPKIEPIPASGYIEVDLGEEVEMGCLVTGVPGPVVTWRTKGETIQLIDNRHKLKFTAENKHMAGLYQCEANNGVGSSVFANIRLRILYKPEIKVDKNWVHASPGVRSELVCRVTADPEANVEWYVEGAPMEFGSTRIVSLVEGERHILLFRNVRTTDFGEYSCKATNIIGETMETIQLSGVANPAIFKKEVGKKPSEDSYTLIWEVDSYSPIIEYNLLFRQWKEDSVNTDWIKLVIPADGYSPGPIHSKSYTLNGLKPATVYQAMLLSRNKFGWSKPSVVHNFATEGADLNVVEAKEEVEENIIPVEVTAIFRERSSAQSAASVGNRFTLIIFFIPILTLILYLD